MILWTLYCIAGIALCVFYIALIGKYLCVWQKIPVWTYADKPECQTDVCVIIPARNEEAFIGKCLVSVCEQDYPSSLLEIIVIDDHSEDETANIVRKIQSRYPALSIRLLSLSDILPKDSRLNAYKKKAIETAIAQTQQSLIITTDADCFMHKNWLRSIVTYYEDKKVALIAAPVVFVDSPDFCHKFQNLDFLGMMIVTGASVYGRLSNMCNGANLAYTGEAFYAVNGFKGIDDIASGDDLLLMDKIAKQYPDQIGFIKSLDTTVVSYPQKDWPAFVQQRLRWASKSAKYEDKRINFLPLFSLLF